MDEIRTYDDKIERKFKYRGCGYDTFFLSTYIHDGNREMQ